MTVRLKTLGQITLPLAAIFFGIVWVMNDVNGEHELSPSLTQPSRGATPVKSQAHSVNKQSFKVALQSPQKVQQNYQHYLKNVPAYLKGTNVRGTLLLDERSELVISGEIKKRFDYFYLLTGDKTPAQINDIIMGSLYSSLADPALQTALDLLEKYFRYMTEYQIMIESLTPQDAQSDLLWLAQDINDLKANIFGEEVAKLFFGNEEALMQESLRLKALNKVSPQGQANVDKYGGTGLPQEVIDNQQKTLSFYHAKQKIKQALDQGAKADDIAQLRNELFGEEAVQRLEKMDAQRRQWQRTIVAYQQIKKELSRSGGLSPSDLDSSLADTMRQSHGLTSVQLRRLAALERIATSTSPPKK